MAIFGMDPAQYAVEEQRRRQEQVQNLIGMLLRMKEHQYDRGIQERQLGRQEQVAGAQEDYYRARAEVARRPPAQSNLQQEIQALVATGMPMQDAVRQAALGRDPQAPEDVPMPPDFQKHFPGVDWNAQPPSARARYHAEHLRRTAPKETGPDKPTQWRDEANHYKGVLDSLASGLSRERDIVQKGLIDNRSVMEADQIAATQRQVDQIDKRLSKLRALQVGLKPGQPIPPETIRAIEAEISGGGQGGGGGLSGLANKAMQFIQGLGQGRGDAPAVTPSPAAQAPTAPEAPAQAAPEQAPPAPATQEITKGTRIRNPKTGEVRVWTGTEWKTISGSK